MAKVSSEKKATIEITLPEHARPLLGKLLMFLAPTFSTGLTFLIILVKKIIDVKSKKAKGEKKS